MHLSPPPGVQRRQFTAVDAVSRLAVVEGRSAATAGTAAACPGALQARAPFPITAIQVDGGSEVKAEFAAECAARGIARFVLPLRGPKLNGRGGRLNRTVRAACWARYDGELGLEPLQEALRAAERVYHEVRPHQAQGYRTPAAHLAALRRPQPGRRDRTSTGA